MNSDQRLALLRQSFDSFLGNGKAGDDVTFTGAHHPVVTFSIEVDKLTGAVDYGDRLSHRLAARVKEHGFVSDDVDDSSFTRETLPKDTESLTNLTEDLLTLTEQQQHDFELDVRSTVREVMQAVRPSESGSGELRIALRQSLWSLALPILGLLGGAATFLIRGPQVAGVAILVLLAGILLTLARPQEIVADPISVRKRGLGGWKSCPRDELQSIETSFYPGTWRNPTLRYTFRRKDGQVAFRVNGGGETETGWVRQIEQLSTFLGIPIVAKPRAKREARRR